MPSSVAMPRVILFLLAVLAVASTAGAAGVTVKVGTAEAGSGEAVAIPLTVKSAANLGSLQADLVYDPAVLEIGKVEAGALLADNCLFETNTTQPGRVRLAVVSKDGISGDGVLATANFTARGAAGATSVLGLERVRAWAMPKHHADTPGMHHLVDVMATAESGTFVVRGNATKWLIVAAVAIGLLLLIIVWRMAARPGTPERR